MPRSQARNILVLKVFALACLALWLFEAFALGKLPGQIFPGFRYEAWLDVSTVNEEHWNGRKAGLEDFDRIVAIDGIRAVASPDAPDAPAIATPEQFETYYRSKPAGTPIRYRIWREGKTFEAEIATQVLSPADWLRSYYLVLMVPPLLFLMVGMVAFWLRPDHKAAAVHLLMTCSVLLFGVTNNDLDATRLLLPLFVVAYPLLGSAMLHLALVFPEPSGALRRRPMLEYLPYAVVPAVAGAWAVFLRPVAYEVDPARYEAHMLVYNLASGWVLLGLLGLIGAVGYKTFRGASEVQRRQARIALIGAASGFLPIVLLWGVPHFLGLKHGLVQEAASFSYLASVLFPLSIAYAMLRAQLFEIRVVVKRTVTYAIVTGALVCIYFFLGIAVHQISRSILGVTDTSTWENLIGTGAVAVAFSPLVNWTRARVDRIFDRGQYDIGELLERYARISDETVDPDRQFGMYMDMADEAVSPSHISIFVRDRTGVQALRAARRIELPPGYATLTDQGELVELGKAGQTGLLAQRARTVPLVEGRQIWGFALYVPLVWQGEVIGRVNFGPKRSDQSYTERDRQLLTSMAHRLADKLRIADMLHVAIAKARLDQELATARAIHSAMLPARDPQLGGLDVAATSHAAVEFGGDYYDLVELDGGRLAVAIGDVAGKGVQAAMVMAMTKAAFSTLVKADPGVSRVMAGLNQMICDTIPDRTYRKTTFCYAILDPAAHELTYACAGHPPPLLFKASGTCQALPAPGAFPFGTTVRSRYEILTVPLEAGDGLVFYTDGVTEATAPDGRTFYDVVPDAGGREIEKDELLEVVTAHAADSSEAIKRAVLGRLRDFTGSPDTADDVTMVVVRLPS